MYTERNAFLCGCRRNHREEVTELNHEMCVLFIEVFLLLNYVGCHVNFQQMGNTNVSEYAHIIKDSSEVAEIRT